MTIVGSSATANADAATFIARALSDPAGVAPDPANAFDAAACIAAASRHRVLLLLGCGLRNARSLHRWPQEFIDAFTSLERQAVVADCIRHVELVNVLEKLSSAGVHALVFKGAALAHTHYPAPHVRVRADTDLLVPLGELAELDRVLGGLGYVRPAETSGRLVSYQRHYHKIDRHGVAHAFDVHWKISNLQVLADRLTWQELWDRRAPVAALGSSAVTIDDAHALLLSLVHVAGHHPGSRNLLWIYDLHLLANRMPASAMLELQTLADARGLGQVVADGLTPVRDCLGNRAVDPIIDALRSRARREDVKLAAGSWTQARVLRLDLDALPTWRARGRLIREHLLPPTSYMRARYGVRSNLLLPGLYVWRALLGAPKWLRRHSDTDA